MVYKNNDLQIINTCVERKFSSSIIGYPNRIFDAKGYIDGNLAVIFLKIKPFDVNYSNLLLLELYPTLKQRNQELQKIDFQQHYVLDCKSKYIIVKVIPSKELQFVYLPKDKCAACFVGQSFLAFSDFLSDREIIRVLGDQTNNMVLKCFEHLSMTDFDTFTCVLQFSNFHFVRLTFLVVQNAIKLVEYRFLENFAYVSGTVATFSKVEISDKFIVTAFIIDKSLSLFIYSTRLEQLQVISPVPPLLNFCLANNVGLFEESFKRFTQVLNSETLPFFSLNDETLSFIADNVFLTYTLYTEITGTLRKHNLMSNKITIKAMNNQRTVKYTFPNELNQSASSGTLKSRQRH